MSFQALDARCRSSLTWRFAGIVVCLWLASFIFFATLTAHNDGIELYSWTMLFLFLVGLPVAMGAVGYSAILLGRKGRKAALLLIASFGVLVAVLQGHHKYSANIILDEEQRVARIADAEEVASAAVQAQVAKDWLQYGEVCTETCHRLGNNSADCPVQCSQDRGEMDRETFR